MICMTGWTSTNIAPVILVGPKIEPLVKPENLSELIKAGKFHGPR